MKNFSFEKNKNIYIIRYKEWELYVDIEKEIIINNKTGEIIDYETMRTTVFEDLAKAHDIGKRIKFISGLYEESDKTKKNESYVSMEVYILETISLKKEKMISFSECVKEIGFILYCFLIQTYVFLGIMMATFRKDLWIFV